MADDKMTRGERSELGMLIRKRERVMKSAVDERALQLMADFEQNMATIYSYDDDAVWKKAAEEAKKVAEAAQNQVAERCKELGIPKEFAPALGFHWSGRGENAVRSRRIELRAMARSRITAEAAKAKTKIEQMSLAAQTEVVTSGLQSDAAKEFLERLPTVEVLMPKLDPVEFKRLNDQKHEGDARQQYQEF